MSVYQCQKATAFFERSYKENPILPFKAKRRAVNLKKKSAKQNKKGVQMEPKQKPIKKNRFDDYKESSDSSI